MNYARLLTVTATDLRQLWQSKDFWIPMLLLGGIFFLLVPAIVLSVITNLGNVDTVRQLSQAIDSLPRGAQEAVPAGSTEQGRISFVLAVHLLAPIAVVVPLTISSAVGAATIVGERERGTGEFLAHSPAAANEIYLGKLLASFVPGYLTTVAGFGVYSLLVNSVVGPEVGGWFFPTWSWVLLIVWVLPPFLVLALSIILRLSARVKSTAAAQQAAGLVTFPLIILAYGQSTGALFGGQATRVAVFLGVVAWVIALISLGGGMRTVTRARLLGVADEQ